MTTYRDLLAAARQNPGEADYLALRQAYASSEEYAPYTHDQEHLEALRTALPARNFQAALEAVEGLLDHNYLDIEAHMAADYVHTLRGDQAQSTYHRTFAQGLINAIMDSGNGASFDTAFAVMSIPEEYLVLRLLGLLPGNQRLVQHEEHWFDILSARRHDDNMALELYFNIDLPRTWLSDNIAAEE